MNFCGIDVSAAELVVALRSAGRDLPLQSFPNSAAGHRRLLTWLGRTGAGIRVTLEATGVYSLDLAMFLAAADDIELAVVNPKLIRRLPSPSMSAAKTILATLASCWNIASACPSAAGTHPRPSSWPCAKSRATCWSLPSRALPPATGCMPRAVPIPLPCACATNWNAACANSPLPCSRGVVEPGDYRGKPLQFVIQSLQRQFQPIHLAGLRHHFQIACRFRHLRCANQTGGAF